MTKKVKQVMESLPNEMMKYKKKYENPIKLFELEAKNIRNF